MAATLEELTAIEKVGPGRYVSKARPENMAPRPGVAYGGCALGVAVRAACATVPASHALYSLMGNYLGPTRTDERIECVIHETRNTKSFATRRIEVQQLQPGGTTRLCLEILADFHVREAGALTYSAPPTRAYAPVRDQPDGFSVAGGVAEDKVAAVAAVFDLTGRHIETRHCREGVGAQNLHGMLKGQATTQDHLPLPARSTAEYVRARHRPPAPTAADQAAALAFLLDGGVVGAPLTLSGQWMDDVAAVASLDFALRLAVPDFDLRRWHLRERTTVAGGHGRTYSEGRLWSDDGTLVAVMTQQGILRPARTPPKM